MKSFILLRFVTVSSNYEILIVFAWCPTEVHGKQPGDDVFHLKLTFHLIGYLPNRQVFGDTCTSRHYHLLMIKVCF